MGHFLLLQSVFLFHTASKKEGHPVQHAQDGVFITDIDGSTDAGMGWFP